MKRPGDPGSLRDADRDKQTSLDRRARDDARAAIIRVTSPSPSGDSLEAIELPRADSDAGHYPLRHVAVPQRRPAGGLRHRSCKRIAHGRKHRRPVLEVDETASSLGARYPAFRGGAHREALYGEDGRLLLDPARIRQQEASAAHERGEVEAAERFAERKTGACLKPLDPAGLGQASVGAGVNREDSCLSLRPAA